MGNEAAIVFSAILAIAATIVIMILVMPERKRDKLNGFFRYLHDMFNFKSLLIEKLLKVLYVLTTTICVFFGFFTIISVISAYGSTYYYFYGGKIALYGLLMMTVGPILVRVVFEIIMLFILLVKNVIEINNRLAQKSDATDTPPEQPW